MWYIYKYLAALKTRKTYRPNSFFVRIYSLLFHFVTLRIRRSNRTKWKPLFIRTTRKHQSYHAPCYMVYSFQRLWFDDKIDFVWNWRFSSNTTHEHRVDVYGTINDYCRTHYAVMFVVWKSYFNMIHRRARIYTYSGLLSDVGVSFLIFFFYSF